MKLYLVAPDIRARDAVGNHCLYLAEALGRSGIDVRLHASRHTEGRNDQVRSLDALLKGPTPSAQDILLLCYSTFQPRLIELLRLECRKVVYFHGVTPVNLLLDHDPAAAYWSSKAMLQLPLLAQCEHLIANSRWNLTELLGHLPVATPEDRVTVMPPITPAMPLLCKPSPEHRKPLSQKPLRLLTVGRLAPHKKIEDVIRMTSELASRGTRAELTIVGNDTSPDYVAFLAQVTQSAGSRDSVCFKGQVSDEELFRCYAEADLMVSASVHEGFCIPILEAMHLGVPVVLRRGTAASEVAAGACLEFDSITEAVTKVISLSSNEPLAEQQRQAGHLRAIHLVRDADIRRLLTIIGDG